MPGRRSLHGEVGQQVVGLVHHAHRPAPESQPLAKVQSKFDILSGVWGLDFDGDPNIVEVYVLRLRRKVDAPFATSVIRTRRGVGYCIDDDRSRAG